MTETKKTPQTPKARKPKLYHGALAAKRSVGDVTTGAAIYREEFRRDIGPDQDEVIDRTESGHEF
jgi:hypothetical protein